MNRKQALGVLLIGSSLLISASYGAWAEKVGEARDPFIKCMPVSSGGSIYSCIREKPQGVEIFHVREMSEKEMKCGSDIQCIINAYEEMKKNN